MQAKTTRPTRGLRWLVLMAVLAAVGFVGALLASPEPARARKGYGNYKPCGAACQVGKCKKQCRKARRTCVYCARADKKAARGTCAQTATQALAACSGDRGCKNTAKTALRACRGAATGRYKQAKGTCKGLTGTCGGCCAENYAGQCRGAFKGTDGYGTYFRTVTYRGKVKTYKPDCAVGGDGTPGPGPGGDKKCAAVCARVRERAVAACGGRRADPACLQQAEAAYQECLARCSPTSTTTTITSSTSSTTIVAINPCGNRTLDPGEGCEGTTGCPSGQHCGAQCQCLPGVAAMQCGNGKADAGEPCDQLLDPSGCGPGEECARSGDQCGCRPLPAVIGRPVSFVLPQKPPITASGLPVLPNGNLLLLVTPDGQLELDPTLKDPITALGKCAGWITGCMAPPARTMDDCARSVPVCATVTPWEEAAPCCAAGCFPAYEQLRRTGLSSRLAFRRAYFGSTSCMPGVASPPS